MLLIELRAEREKFFMRVSLLFSFPSFNLLVFMRHLLYIINPISGTRNKQSVQQLVEEKTKAADLSYTIHHSVASGDYSFLEEEIRDKKITDIVVAGGDGTINAAVSQLAKFELPFGIIPCGSGNGLAFSAGIPKDPEKALDVIFKGKSKWTDAFTINGRFACMLCGLGLDAQVAHDFANAPKRGLLTYVRKTIADFIKAPAYPFVLHNGGKEIKTNAFFISIANSNQFGNNFTIAPKASLTDGLLDIVIMTKQSKISALFNTVRQISGFNQIKSMEMVHENSSLIYFQTDAIRISNPGLAPMHIDGDPMHASTEVEVKVMKEAFQLLVP